MDESAIAFIEKNSSAGMTTLRADGSAHTVRVGVGFLDGKLWSSGTQSRLRTRHLRHDPRCTLFVYESGEAIAGAYRYLTLETTVTLLEGPDAPELSVRFFQALQLRLPTPPQPGHLQWYGQQKTIAEFRQQMIDEQRLIYEFEVTRSYGMY